MPDAPAEASVGAGGTDARSRLMERVARRAEAFPDLPIDAPDTAGLAPRDAALLRALDAAVTRRWLTLVTLVESRLDRPWLRVEAPLQAALLVGAAQLVLFDRLPDHAVVDASAGWARRARGPRGAGFVNAVLRRVAELRDELLPATTAPFAERRDELPLSDGRAWRLREEIFGTDLTARLAQVGSVGRELFLHWIAAHGFAAARDLARHGLVDPPTLLTGAPPALADDPRLVPHSVAGWFAFAGTHGELLELLAAHPTLRVQDPASGDPVAAAQRAGLAPRVIVDLCAGRGTKTAQLALAFPGALVVASDPDAQRAADLARLATRHANVEAVEPAALARHFQGADLVVLDVPCSNTAVLPRRPEASYRFNRQRLEGLVAAQRSIAVGALPLLRPGGHVLYATCSLEPAENARQSEWFAKRGGMTIVAERQRFPAGAPGEPPTAYADGGFWSLLRHRER